MYICKDGDCGYKGKEKQCCKECQHEKTCEDPCEYRYDGDCKARDKVFKSV